MEGLSAKQQRFVSEFVVDWNATQAAVRSGYSPKTAEQQGCRLLRNVQVVETIKAVLEEGRQRNNVSVDSLTDELEEARKRAMEEGQLSVAVSAVMGKAKLHGLEVNRHKVSGELMVGKIERVIVHAENTNS